MAAVDYFLKIEGISGESIDDKHKNEIEVESFSWGVTQAGTAHPVGGAGAGKAVLQPFHFTKVIDKSSPTLFQKCATGEHIKSAVLTARKAGGEQQQEFLKITMSDVLVSSYQNGGASTPTFDQPPSFTDVAALAQNLTTDNAFTSGSGAPGDQVALNYAKIEFLEGNPQRIGIEPTGAGVLTFNAKTQTVTVGDWNGDGVAPVGVADGNIMRAVQEFDVKILIGLLTAPFSNSSLHLLVNEWRGPVTTPGETIDASSPGTISEGPQPHLRFDVLFYRNADNTVDAADLTRPGKRIGQLTVEPTDPNLASLDINLLPILAKHDTDSFGIRIQLHGAGIPEPLETAEDRDEESGETAPSGDVSAFFSMTLSFDTA